MPTNASPDLLTRIAAGNAFDAGGVAVIVAHPDDETIGCGALLQRMRGVAVVIVTNGAAPADAAYGFASPQAYAEARSRELHRALTGAPLGALMELGYADQSAAHRLIDLSLGLDVLVRARSIRTSLTHAYEGGHPDHDAVAFAAHWTGAEIIEMPYYRQGPAGPLFQSFPGDEGVVTQLLSPEQRARKAAMISAHATQAAVLAPLSRDRELFRPTPRYDFRRLPNDGAVYYDAWPWGLTSAEWPRLASAALDVLSRWR